MRWMNVSGKELKKSLGTLPLLGILHIFLQGNTSTCCSSESDIAISSGGLMETG